MWINSRRLLVIVVAKEVLAPLPDIALHVVEFKLIWLFPSNRMGRAIAVAFVPAYPLQIFFAVAGVKPRGCPRAAGVFPFGLGRQSDRPSGGL